MLTLGQGRPRASSHAAQETAREKIQKGQGAAPARVSPARALQLPTGSAGKHEAPTRVRRRNSCRVPASPTDLHVGEPGRAPALTQSKDVRAGGTPPLSRQGFILRNTCWKNAFRNSHVWLLTARFSGSTQCPGNPPRCTALLAASSPGRGTWKLPAEHKGPAALALCRHGTQGTTHTRGYLQGHGPLGKMPFDRVYSKD